MANGRHCKRVHGEIHRTWFTSMEPLTTWYRCMGSPMTTWALSLIQSLSDMGPGGLVTSWEEPEHMSTPRWAPPRNFNQTWDPWDFDETVNLSRLAIESDCEKQGVASHWSVWMVRHCGDTAGPTLCHREWGFRQTPQNLWMFNFYRTSNLHQICTSELKRCKAGFRRKVILVRPEEGLWQCNPSSSWRFLTRVWTPVWECHLSEIIFFCWTSVCGLSATMLPVLHQFLFYFWVLVLCMGRFQPFCRTIHVGLIWYTSIYMRHCWSYIIWNNLFPHYHTYVSVTCFPATRARRAF